MPFKLHKIIIFPEKNVKGEMPFKMHKIIFFQKKKNEKNVCLRAPTLPKIF